MRVSQVATRAPNQLNEDSATTNRLVGHNQIESIGPEIVAILQMVLNAVNIYHLFQVTAATLCDDNNVFPTNSATTT